MLPAPAASLGSHRPVGENQIMNQGIVTADPFRPGNGMAQGLSVALYFLVCRELGEKPVFPGNKFSWNILDNQSSAAGLADLTIWATTQEHTANEAFNHVNGDIFCHRDLFPRIGAYFGVKVILPPRPNPADHVRLIFASGRRA